MLTNYIILGKLGIILYVVCLCEHVYVGRDENKLLKINISDFNTFCRVVSFYVQDL